MKITVGHRYQTKCGNIVKCVAKVPNNEELFICVYSKVIEGHESLRNKQSVWQENGAWDRYNGGIHDIVKAD
jgi:hypothetical protein